MSSEIDWTVFKEEKNYIKVHYCWFCMHWLDDKSPLRANRVCGRCGTQLVAEYLIFERLKPMNWLERLIKKILRRSGEPDAGGTKH